MTINGTEIWPDNLRALSAAGPSRLGDDGIATVHGFAAATPAGDADIIVQYAVDDMGFIDTNVFQGEGDRWTEYDPEDGPNYDRPAEWKDLAVIMARDRMTNMVALRRDDAAPATKDQLKAAAHGSLVTVLGDGARLLFKSHDEWIDLDYGVDAGYKSGRLLKLWPNVGMVWVAPESE